MATIDDVYREEIAERGKRFAEHFGVSPKFVLNVSAESGGAGEAILHVELFDKVDIELFNRLWFGGNK